MPNLGLILVLEPVLPPVPTTVASVGLLMLFLLFYAILAGLTCLIYEVDIAGVLSCLIIADAFVSFPKVLIPN